MSAWDWSFAWKILPSLLDATRLTIIAAIGGYIIASVIGLLFLLLQRMRWRPIRIFVRELVEFLRSTPLIVQIFFIFYIGPQFGLILSPWTAGMIALGIHNGAFLSEVYRAGVESVPKGQWEAATALNLSTATTYRRIILPQALFAAIPGMGNYLVSILKDTPLLGVIGVTEILARATAIGGESYRFLEPYTIVGIIFLLLSIPTALLADYVGRLVRRGLGLQK